MATIKEIAKITGVSITTVSRVLNQDKSFSVSDQTRLKILQVAEELNYTTPNFRNNKNKSEKGKKRIGLVYWYTQQEELNDPYYFSLRISIENACKKNNIGVEQIYYGKDNFDFIKSLKLDGIIAVGKYSQSFIEKLYSINPNLVIVDYWTKHYYVDSVISDFTGATTDIIEYFHQKNFYKIGMICGVEHTIDGEEVLDARLVTYKIEMNKLNLFSPKNIYLGKFTADSGFEIMSNIIKNDELVDGYIVASDTMAIGCLKALNEHNIRVPDVISIISYNNTSLAQFTIPSLSSVNTNTKLMGESAVDLMLERFKTGRRTAKKVTIPTQIVFRDSSI